jgi:hypothetical protein
MLRWTALWTFSVNPIYAVLVLWVLLRCGGKSPATLKLETRKTREGQIAPEPAQAEGISIGPTHFKHLLCSILFGPAYGYIFHQFLPLVLLGQAPMHLIHALLIFHPIHQIEQCCNQNK